MNTSRYRTSRETSPHRSERHAYNVSAYLNFVPGGIEYESESNSDSNTASPSAQPRLHHYALNVIAPEAVVSRAHNADNTLRKYAVRFAHENSAASDPVIPPHRLPSLSILAEAAFGPLTGVHAASVRKWADTMVLAYLHDKNDGEKEIRDILHASEDDLVREFEETKNNISPASTSVKPSSSPRSPTQKGNDLVHVLKVMHQNQMNASDPNDTSSSPMPVRPCGYVFKRNDIAWNCRTCQTDSTCVICDSCFHASDHEGHEVYFHRTSPGGCCDCGDVEAWKAEGCCPAHRPRTMSSANDVCTIISKDENMVSITNSTSGLTEDKLDFEAVKASQRGRADGETCVKEMLAPKFSAALGVVIGAAVNSVIQAIDGASIGADPVQWTRRWADQLRRIRDNRPFDEEYVMNERKASAKSISEAMNLEFPNRFKLHLRLHNDDIHTYDEVTDALYRKMRGFNSNQSGNENDETDTSNGIVATIDDAKEMTGRVDSDGQCVVRGYSTIKGAMAGFERLKKFGLHCAVVSSPQIDLELRARVLLSWLSDVADAHPAAAALVVHALVDVTEGRDSIGETFVWGNSRMLPPWSFTDGYFASATKVSIQENKAEDHGVIPGWRRRMDVFPPNLHSSFLTREESQQLHSLSRVALNETSSFRKGVDFYFYSKIPYQLPSERFRKSPHSLWGVMPSPFTSPKKFNHPFIHRGKAGNDEASFHLTESLIVLETDLRKPQETDMLILDCYTHRLLGLHMISGVGVVDVDGDENGGSAMKPTAEDWQQILSIASYRAPISPILMMLLLDPYPPKQLRAAIHPLFLSLLVDSRMKSRFAASLGGIAYRPLTTLYCAGVGTEIDSPLSFTVQIFTTGSLVRALCNIDATKKLLTYDGDSDSESEPFGFDDSVTVPVAHNIVRCIHTNLLGSCKEVKMVLKNTAERRSSMDTSNNVQRNKHLSALIYQQGESPLITLLPAAPDDAFLDARSTKHKRLPPLIRDLEYVFETPGTALRLLLPYNLSSNEFDLNGDNLHHFDFEIPHFPTMWCRLLRLAQGVDPQKRKVSGGHVEYEQVRWLEAYSLSLHFAGACSKFAESLAKPVPNTQPPQVDIMRESIGNSFVAILREMKLWLYKENILDSGLPQTSGSHLNELQRSTLHVSMATLGMATASSEHVGRPTALNCEVNTKMKEIDLEMIENAIRIEQSQFQLNGAGRGAIMADWLRVPHSPHAGNTLSFHLPLHRALARNIRTYCSLAVPEEERRNDDLWWLLPIVDGNSSTMDSTATQSLEHPLSTLLRPSLRSANCRVIWAAGPECNSNEAQHRRSRARAVSAAITASKIIHSLCDHPLRCLAATEQISRHLWARNGASAVGMAINYSAPPLCQSFRDLDLTMVQLSTSGLCIGLGARRVFSLILSRFDLEGYLCDVEKKGQGRSPTNGGAGSQWKTPPNIQDVDHAPSLAEALFTTICVLVTELPPPPPLSNADDTFIRMHIRRGLLHSLSVAPLSYSKAMEAASNAVASKDSFAGFDGNDDGPLSFRTIFGEVLREITSQKSQGSRSTAAPKFELNCSVSDEYDPSFFHLKRSDHQQAMDNIARLRKQKFSSKGERNKGKCLPLVGAPPIAHPRFTPCRLLLHISALDAAIRRALMFALTGGEWTPPEQPTQIGDVSTLESQSFSSEVSNSSRRMHRSEKKKLEKKATFGPKVVNNSSVSILEVLQLLTLQVHTLEDCARLHETHPILDHEMKTLSASISINSYLGRLVHVPSSLVDAWAFRCAPEGPLTSHGSGLNRASILGLLIALYEHKSDKSALNKEDLGHGEEGLGGARFLVSSGLKWILRYISTLVHGAPDNKTACECATNGIQYLNQKYSKKEITWSIEDHLKSTISGMLENLPELWPSENSNMSDVSDGAEKVRNKEAMLAAKKRAMERMKKQQASFAASISTDEQVGLKSTASDEDANLCIICRCDDEEGNNGPIGFLGHVQRSRTQQLRSRTQSTNSGSKLSATYRVVGDMGCQIRADESMDSEPIECIPVGSLVTVKQSKVSFKYGLKSRRVLISYESPVDGKVSEGWASVQSAQGYTILSPVMDVCCNNTRWGSTRPIFRLCGHAAHLGCVARHVASIHQKAEQEAPFDGRFAAEIGDGEFLCPLCKQLSNIVVPVQENEKVEEKTGFVQSSTSERMEDRLESLTSSLKNPNQISLVDERKKIAMKQYGNYLYQAMEVTSWNKNPFKNPWHNILVSWDFKEDLADESDNGTASIGDILPLFRQLHISWSATGHLAASAEASARGIRKSGFEPPTSDPWTDFNEDCKDTHPILLELRRTMVATASLFDVVSVSIFEQLSVKGGENQDFIPIVGNLLSDIISGKYWTNEPNEISTPWKVLTALLASIPCHVSRDETLDTRHQARATAAQIWSVKNGNSTRVMTDEGDFKESPHPSPSAPKCIRSIPDYNDVLKGGWGTMDLNKAVTEKNSIFRPAFASGFLYMPLLAWDLNTLAGALFSSLLSSKNLSQQTFGDVGRILLIARIIQVIVTPNIFEMHQESQGLEAELNVKKENDAIKSLIQHCNSFLHPNNKSTLVKEDSSDHFVMSLSFAILPFARTLTLLLRGAFSAARHKGIGINDKLEDFVLDEDTMYIEDGFYFLQKLGCPLPSELFDSIAESSNDENKFWAKLINNWMNAIASFDAYHGSQGFYLDYNKEKQSWQQVKPSTNANKKLKSEKHVHQSSGDHNDSTATSTMNVETSVDSEIQMNGNIEDMVDVDDMSVDNPMPHFQFDAVDSPIDRSVVFEDVEDVDEDSAEDFPDVFGLPSLPSQPSHDNSIINQNDEDSVCVSCDLEDDIPDNDELCADISGATIIPFQPSVLGHKNPGPGPRGSSLDYSLASTVMCDLSHLGSVHNNDVKSSGLIELPKSYVELYSLVNKFKATAKSALDDGEDFGSGETAICLITGAILRAGLPRRHSRRSSRPPGACTLHARQIGSGTGVFFLLQKCTVLLLHNKKSAYSASLYVDENGEEDTGLTRGRPLFLKDDRYEALENLWRSHGIPREVAQIRCTSDRVIRDDWY